MMDDQTLHEQIDLDVDGALSPAVQPTVEAMLARHPELDKERRELIALHRLLESDRIEVSSQFTEQVMADLPAASWESRKIALAVPIAVLAFFGVAASVLLAGAEIGAGLGTALALFDFFETAALASAGLLTASWQGAGLTLAALWAESPVNVVMLVVFVVCLDLLVLSMLRRPVPIPADAANGQD
ncbi:MAG: hypothetical protein AAGD38_17200 [Acidobacteriota bacterium]